MSRRQQWALLDASIADNIVKNTRLPDPLTQLDNLILWLGEKQPHMGDEVEFTEQIIAAVGAVDESNIGFLIAQAVELQLIKGSAEYNFSKEWTILPMKLTLTGWQKFGSLKRGDSSSVDAFMAMPFGRPELDVVFQSHFKPAVAQAGFYLKRLDENQPAGLIDDRLRVEIRQCRFLIADLTHGNAGAYWEAGYAEGLGRPVIYTCRKDRFDDKSSGPHFDTNHHLTVVWDPNSLEDAAKRLKNTIRATLPDQAKLND